MGNNGSGGGGGAGGAGRSGRSRESNITKRDIDAIQLYAGNGDYVLINEMAMNGKAQMLQEFRELAGSVSQNDRTVLNRIERAIGRIDRSLDKLPDYQGTTYRVMNWGKYEAFRREEFVNQHVVGDIVQYRSFTSSSTTTTNPYFKYNNPERGTVRIQIRSKTGKNVSQYSRAPEENEVIHRRNTQFRVISKTRRGKAGKGGWDITLEEI